MRPNWGSISVNALILVVAFIAGYAIRGGGPKLDGNPVGPLNFSATNSPSLTSNPNVGVATNCINGTTPNCLVTLQVATTVSPSPAPNPSACPGVGSSGCFVIGGQMQSVDAAGIKETVNLTETLDFQPAKSTSLSQPRNTLAQPTPPPVTDGNPVGFHATGRANIQPAAQFKWPPPCLASQTCSVTIDLKMPHSASAFNCTTSYCLKFSGASMAVNSLDWDNAKHPETGSSEPKDITGTIYIGP